MADEGITMRRLKRSMRKAARFTAGNWFSVLLFLAVLLAAANGFHQASAAREEEALRIARESIRRAAISCYAVEGSYPDGFEYLRRNYGVSIDQSKYVVHYQIFASNIMPDITVLKK